MHSELNRPKMGRLLKCTEKMLLRLTFDEEHDAVGPGIVISLVYVLKSAKNGPKSAFFGPNWRKNF